jgi:hypothetical protein
MREREKSSKKIFPTFPQNSLFISFFLLSVCVLSHHHQCFSLLVDGALNCPLATVLVCKNPFPTKKKSRG